MKYLKSFEDFNTISPDRITYSDMDLKYFDNDAISFQYDKVSEKWIFGQFGENHVKLLKQYGNNPWDYNGRLWKNEKIIIFWVYPDLDWFEEFIYLLEEFLNEKVWNNGWRIFINRYNTFFENGKMELIPIEEYKNSGDFSEELYKIHLDNRKNKNVKSGWGSKNSKNNREWRNALGESIIPFKLFENPDNIKYQTPDTDKIINIDFEAKDSISFGYDKENNKMLVGKNNHYYLVDRGRYVMIYSGRLWYDCKVISFWEYPTKEELPKILEDIKNSCKETLNIDINFKDKWKIEIIYKSEWLNIKISEDDLTNPNDKDWTDEDFKSKLIPLSTYIGSEKRTEEDLSTKHIEKEKNKDVTVGWGSKNSKNNRDWRKALGESKI